MSKTWKDNPTAACCGVSPYNPKVCKLPFQQHLRVRSGLPAVPPQKPRPDKQEGRRGR